MKDESGLSLRNGQKIPKSNLNKKVILLYFIETIVFFGSFFALGEKVFGPKYYDSTWNSKLDMLTSNEIKVDFDYPFAVASGFAATILGALLTKTGRSIYQHISSRKESPYRQTGDLLTNSNQAINTDEEELEKKLINQKIPLQPQSSLSTWSSRIGEGVVLMPALFFLNLNNAFVGQLVTTGQFMPQSGYNYFLNNSSHQQGVYFTALIVLGFISMYFLTKYVRELETDTFTVANVPRSRQHYQTFDVEAAEGEEEEEEEKEVEKQEPKT